MEPKKEFNNQRLGHRRGLTFVELMVVVVILGLLGAVVMPRLVTGRQKEEWRNVKEAQIPALITAIKSYGQNNPSVQLKGPDFLNHWKTILGGQYFNLATDSEPDSESFFTRGVFRYWLTTGMSGLDPNQPHICAQHNKTNEVFCSDLSGTGIAQGPGSNSICGNGVVDPGEACDGNGQACSSGVCDNCSCVGRCGNNVTEFGEQCDGTDISACATGACNSICQCVTVCGNNAVEAGEQCDDGNVIFGDGCSPNCQIEVNCVCGDGVVATDCGESCEPPTSSTAPGACGPSCRINASPATCGNNITETGELCDGAGTCPFNGSCISNCHACCGNGTLEVGELCDPLGDVGCSGAEPCNSSCDACVCASDADCDDLNGCTTNLCQNGACIFTPMNCDDGNSCTDDSCITTDSRPGAGGSCRHVYYGDGISCDDGNACSTNDQCQGGSCTGDSSGTAGNSCDDQLGCTTNDRCQNGTCQGDFDSDTQTGQACDDGNVCTGNSFCRSDGSCVGQASQFQCNDNNDCTIDSCDPVSGCSNTPILDGVECDDHNACTGDGHCSSGECVVIVPQFQCPDNNPCTNDSCDPATGQCIHSNIPDGVVCDQDPCLTDGQCVNGQCVGTPLCADDGDPCTLESCDPQSGVCSVNIAPDGFSCDDGNACSGEDKCVSGACQSGELVICDDGNSCTSDNCDSANGCIFLPVPNDTTCDDHDSCTGGDRCVSGQCKGRFAKTPCNV